VPSDAHEREADRVADQVMATPASQARRASLPGLPASAPGALDALPDGGQPLSESERAFFEPRFGANFVAVRIHTGPRAALIAAALNARAFTVGNDIVFGAGHHAPRSAAGRTLMAHELQHTLQNARDADADHQVIRRSPIVTEGPFGRALGKFTELHFEDQEGQLEQRLAASSTFSQMAEKLDTQVGLPGEVPIWDHVTRIVQFVGVENGPRFEPREVPENTSLIDWLYVLWPFPTFEIDRPLTDDELDEIADTIVHETTHLYDLVNGPASRAPGSAMGAIATGVTAERRTRQSEARAQQEMIEAGLRGPETPPATDSERIQQLEEGQTRALIERSLTMMLGPTTTYLEGFTLAYLQQKEASALDAAHIRLAQDLARELGEIVPATLAEPLEPWAAYRLYCEVHLATTGELTATDGSPATGNLREGLDDHFVDYMTTVLAGWLFSHRWDEFVAKARDPALGLTLEEYVALKEDVLTAHAALLSQKAAVRYSHP
jgi:hypothetical protein